MTLSRRSFFKRTGGTLVAGLLAHWATKEEALAAGNTEGLTITADGSWVNSANQYFSLVRAAQDIPAQTLVEYVDGLGTVSPCTGASPSSFLAGLTMTAMSAGHYGYVQISGSAYAQIDA